MTNFIKLATALALAGSTTAAISAPNPTIDQMYVATFGHYTQDYSSGGSFMIFPQADYYKLSDGSTWQSGAGWEPTAYATLAAVHDSGSRISYTFDLGADHILFQNVDYSFGDHSSQGSLGGESSLTLTAQAGSSTGVVSGYTTVLSNDMTWYGEPRFNYYSAPVGTRVWFEETIGLSGAVFSDGLFGTDFNYNESGVVDFTRQASAVPESGTATLMIAGLGLLWARRRRFGASVR